MLGVAVIEATLMAVLIGFAFYSMRVSDRAHLQKRAEDAAVLVATMSTGPMLSLDTARLSALVNRVDRLPGLMFVRILDARGRVLAEKALSKPADLGIPGRDWFKAAAPIAVSGIDYGRVVVGLDAHGSLAFQRKVVWRNIMIAGLDIFCVGLFLLLLSYLLGKRILQLRDVAQQVQAGRYGLTVDVEGRDEFSQLQRSFNHMSVDLKRREESRLETEKRLRLASSVFQYASEGILITDMDGVIVDANDAFCDRYGLRRAELLGERPSLLGAGIHDREFFAEMWTQLRETGVWSGEVVNRRRNARLQFERLTINVVHNAAGEGINMVALYTDMNQQVERRRMLESVARTDPLTQLNNRKGLYEYGDNAVKGARKYNLGFCVFFIDVDGFKSVNDEFGHAEGDQVLKIIAMRMTRAVRASDLVARIGGDEFVVLVDGHMSAQEMGYYAERLVQVCAKPIRSDEHVVKVSASVGVAAFSRDRHDVFEAVIQEADSAMYEAKGQGKNRFVLSSP